MPNYDKIAHCYSFQKFFAIFAFFLLHIFKALHYTPIIKAIKAKTKERKAKMADTNAKVFAETYKTLNRANRKLAETMLSFVAISQQNTEKSLKGKKSQVSAQ